MTGGDLFGCPASAKTTHEPLIFQYLYGVRRYAKPLEPVTHALGQSLHKCREIQGQQGTSPGIALSLVEYTHTKVA